MSLRSDIILRQAAEDMRHNPTLRHGQSVANAAARFLDSGTLDQVWGSEYDPYHDDSKIEIFLAEIDRLYRKE